MERQRKVRLAKETKVGRRPRLAIRIRDFRQLANVSTGNGERYVASAGSLLQLLVGIAVGFGFRLVTNLYQPSDVPQQVDEACVADPHAGARAVPMQLPLVDHFAQRRRVQQPAQLARS